MSPANPTPQRLAAERLDVLETLPARRGCNVLVGDARQSCGRRVVARLPGYFGTYRVCDEHEPAVHEHNRVVRRILTFPEREI